jgi:predicted RNA-binding Zn ribbon-like protein
LYFYDTSPKRSRRWCSMATCGNRAKAARHYARSKD